MPRPAAQLADNVLHGPPILGVPCPTVLIANKPAWTVGKSHTCTMVNAPPPVGPGTPHGPGVVIPPGNPMVLIGNMPAAALGDQHMEPAALVPLPPPNPILMGAPTVLV